MVVPDVCLRLLDTIAATARHLMGSRHHRKRTATANGLGLQTDSGWNPSANGLPQPRQRRRKESNCFHWMKDEAQIPTAMLNSVGRWRFKRQGRWPCCRRQVFAQTCTPQRGVVRTNSKSARVQHNLPEHDPADFQHRCWAGSPLQPGKATLGGDRQQSLHSPFLLKPVPRGTISSL